KQSWTELARDEIAESAPPPTTDGAIAGNKAISRARLTPMSGVHKMPTPSSGLLRAQKSLTPMGGVQARLGAPKTIPPSDTRTSAKFGFERREDAPVPSVRPSRAPIAIAIGLPLLALTGVGVWHFGLRDDGAAPRGTTAPAATTAQAAVVTPIA